MLPEDFADDARKRMVDSQLRPNQVSDPRILDAMRHLSRERFLPERQQALAYADQHVPVAPGRVMMQPMLLARLIQAGDFRRDERVLLAGAGTGYAAAVLAALGCQVIALEEPGPLADRARAILGAVAPAVECVTGPLTAGWPAAAPYDGIVIEGSVPGIAPVLAAQLRRDSGRIVAIIGDGERTGYAALALPTGGGLSVRALFDARVPVIPAFAPRPGFTF